MLKRDTNLLLEEYKKQTASVLNEKDIKIYEDYSFYDVYQVTIGGYDGGCGCCQFITGCGCLICLCNICMYS